MAVLPQYQYQVGTPNAFLAPSQQERLYSNYWTGGQPAQQSGGYANVQPFQQVPQETQRMANNHSSGPLLGQSGPRVPARVQQPQVQQPQVQRPQQYGYAGMGNTTPTPILGMGTPQTPPRNNYQNLGNPFQSAPEPNRPAISTPRTTASYGQGLGMNPVRGNYGSIQRPMQRPITGPPQMLPRVGPPQRTDRLA